MCEVINSIRNGERALENKACTARTSRLRYDSNFMQLQQFLVGKNIQSMQQHSYLARLSHVAPASCRNKTMGSDLPWEAFSPGQSCDQDKLFEWHRTMSQCEPGSSMSCSCCLHHPIIDATQLLILHMSN